MTQSSLKFRAIWVVDTEYHPNGGDLFTPVALVAKELISGGELQFRPGEFPAESPFEPDALIVAFFSATAEMQFFRILGWRMPKYLLDQWVEHRNFTNGLPIQYKCSLLGINAANGHSVMGEVEKTANRKLITDQTSWTDEEMDKIIKYCREDVEASINIFYDDFD